MGCRTFCLGIVLILVGRSTCSAEPLCRRLFSQTEAPAVPIYNRFAATAGRDESGMEWRGDQEGRVRVSDPGGRLIYRITGRMHPVSAVLPIGTEHALIGYADGVVELVQTEPWSTRGARVLTVFYFEDELPVRIDQDPKTREIFASNRHQVLCIGRDGGAPRISPWVGWMQGWRSHGDWKVRSIR